jgi:methyl-accepting chemotaxis protein
MPFSIRLAIANWLLAASRAISPVCSPPIAQVADLPEPAPEHPAVAALAAAVQHQQRLAESAQAIAGGNLAREVYGVSEDDGLAAAFREMLSGLRRLVGQVKDAAVDVDRGAQAAGGAIRSADGRVADLRGGIEAIARGADEQMTQVHAAASAITRVSGEVDQVAAVALDLAAASERARRAAERGGEAVRSTVAGMRSIADSSVQAAGRVQELDSLSQRIGAVVATIDNLAEQTNLLALNAAIEAARAGTYGRGFAVVAAEVRKLAERSRRETHQIGELIRHIQDETRTTARQMLADADVAQRERARADQAAEALTEIVAAVVAAAGQVDAISEAAHAASDGTHALASMMLPVREVAESNADATREMERQVEESTQAMRAARDGVEALTGTAERLRGVIAHFQLTEARRESVNIAVTVRSSGWTGARRARIVDLSATGARVEDLVAAVGSELDVSFVPTGEAHIERRRARVMRSAVGEHGPWVGIAFVDCPDSSVVVSRAA